jgi:hypothetical protein
MSAILFNIWVIERSAKKKISPRCADFKHSQLDKKNNGCILQGQDPEIVDERLESVTTRLCTYVSVQYD